MKNVCAKLRKPLMAKPCHVGLSSASERHGDACNYKDAGWRCHHVMSPVGMQGLRCEACGQEHFLPTNATAVELMRKSFVKTVKLRVHVALQQHACLFFLTGRYQAGRPLGSSSLISVCYNSSYWLSLQEPLAATALTHCLCFVQCHYDARVK